MFIGYITISIFIPHSRSLKNKRQVLERMKQRIKNHFNVSIAEKPSDKWQTSELSFVCVNYAKRCVNEVIDRIEDSIRYNNDIHIVDREKQIL